MHDNKQVRRANLQGIKKQLVTETHSRGNAVRRLSEGRGRGEYTQCRRYGGTSTNLMKMETVGNTAIEGRKLASKKGNHEPLTFLRQDGGTRYSSNRNGNENGHDEERDDEGEGSRPYDDFPVGPCHDRAKDFCQGAPERRNAQDSSPSNPPVFFDRFPVMFPVRDCMKRMGER